MKIAITIVAVAVHLQSADMLDCHALIHLWRYQKWTKRIVNIFSCVLLFTKQLSCYLNIFQHKKPLHMDEERMMFSVMTWLYLNYSSYPPSALHFG